MSKPIPDQVADRLQQQQEMEAARVKQTQQLYTMKCFESLFSSDGFPMVTRVPGGWLWYTKSGGGGLKLSMGEGNEEDPIQQLVGSQTPILVTTFVPFDNEFMMDGRGQGNLDS